MLKGLVRVSTVDMSREDWLIKRKLSIGGSDAAGILGMSPYSSPFAVWADKTGKLADKPDNEAMRQGRDLEDYVATRFREETGKRVRRERALLYNPAYPFAHADIDRWVIGENAGLECKTTSALNLKRFKDGNYPVTYYTQCVHYMAVTGADRWYLGVLVLGQGFHLFVIERDEEEINGLMQQEAAFWDLVQTDRPPAVEGATATTQAISAIYAEEQNGCVELFGREGLLREYQELLSQEKEIGAQAEAIKQTLMLDLAEHQSGLCGPFSVRWKAQSRRSFDEKTFLADHPDIEADAYWKQTTFRRFGVKEEKSSWQTRKQL